MRLRRKLLSLAFPVFFLFALLIALLARFFLLDEFARIEDKAARQDASRAANAIGYEIASLDHVARDWGWWDETAHFIRTHDPLYVENNLTDVTFISLQLNLMVYVDPSGKLVEARGFDLEETRPVAVPDSLLEQLTPGSALLRPDTARELLSGILVLPEGPLLLVSTPILDNNGQGPSQGTFVVGRFLNQARLDHLSEVTSLPIRMITSEDAGFSSRLGALGITTAGEPHSLTPDYRTMEGVILLNDLYDRPALLLSVDLPREAYMAEIRGLVIFAGALFAGALIVVGLALVQIDTLMVRRVVDLSKRMTAIGAGGDRDVRLPVKGGDEIAALSRSINGVLDGLERSEQALRLSENRYRAIVEGQSELVCRWRPDGTITFVNEAFCVYFELDREQLIGQNFSAMYPEKKVPMEDYFAALRQEPHTWINEQRTWAPNGEERWQQWVDQACFDGYGQLSEILSVGRDITERVALEKQLTRRAELERIITELSSRFVDLSADEAGPIFQAALKTIGKFVGVDRSYIFFFDFEEKIMRNVYEYCAPGIEPQIERLQAVPMESLPWTMERMTRHKNMYVPSVEDLPEEATAEKELFKSEDIQSLLCVPMVSGSDLIGFLGFDSVRSKQVWSDETIQLLNLAADIMASAVERLDHESRLLAQQHRLSVLNEITQAALFAPDLQWMLGKAADMLRIAVQAEACLILIGEATGKQPGWASETAAASGKDAEWLRQAANDPEFLTAINPVLHQRDCLAVEDLSALPQLQDSFLAANFNMLCRFPLVAARLEIGLALLFFQAPRRLSQDELSLYGQITDQVALGVLKSRALTDAHDRLAEAETLRQANRLIAVMLEPDETIDRILDQLQSVVPYDNARVLLFRGRDLEIVGGRGLVDPGAEIGTRFPVPGDNPHTPVIQQRAPLLLKDGPQSYPGFWRPPHDHIRSWLGVPLIVHGQLIGMLAIDKRERDFYKPTHVVMVSSFADQVAISLENARLFESEHRRALELEALRETVADIISERELPTLLRSIVERASTLLNATGGELGLIEDDTSRLHIVVSLNLGDNFTDKWIQRGEGVMGFVAETFEPFVIDDYSAWEGRSPSYEEVQLRAALGAPLMVGGRLLGVLGVGTSDPERCYTESDLNLLNLFAQQAAIAVENARLFEEIKSRAITDDLTGLYNRRGLFELGEREIELAARRRRPLSVIMFDIDHFKGVNDRFSHATGDEVLRQLAALCRRNVRASDILGRYGGEEFAVLLPETGLAEAVQIAERFRLAVENATIEVEALKEKTRLQVTVSCGVMCARGEIPELAVLLDRADTALYAAKQTGRNCTCSYEPGSAPGD